MDDCMRRIFILFGNFPFRICPDNRADVFDVRFDERVGAGLLLSAGIVAFGTAF